MVRRFFADAWVLLDRVDHADDSAEALFRFMRRRERETNAWFVVGKHSPDHRRLRRAGYRRVIPYGSLRWKLLMLNCRQLVSSSLDPAVTRPRGITEVTTPSWRFAFLQHGVLTHDRSAQLNAEDLDLLITSTRAEYDSVVKDGSPYRYSARETALTGLPRFDRLVRVAGRFSPERRDLLLLAPSWRSWLVGSSGPHAPTSDPVAVADSEFGKEWLSLAESPELEALASSTGSRSQYSCIPHWSRCPPR